MIRQCFYLREDKLPICVMVAEYDSAPSIVIMEEAIRRRYALHPGVYIITAPNQMPNGQPYVDGLAVYTVKADLSIESGLRIRLPRLTTWPPKQ